MKRITGIMLSAVALLASCGGSKTVGDVDFTCDGIFEDLPYTLAKLDFERAEFEKKGNDDFSATGKAKVFNIEDLGKKLDDKEIPFERCVGGKTEKISGLKLQFEGQPYNSMPTAEYKLVFPEDYQIGKEEGKNNRIIPVDNDGIAIDLYDIGHRWLANGIGIGLYPHRLDIQKNVEEMLNRNSFYDRIARLVEVDDAALEEYSKKMDKAKAEKDAEAAKDNDLSKVQLTEKGVGPVTLGKYVGKLPPAYENLYTSYKSKVDNGLGVKVYDFYNGEEKVVTLYADIKTGKIFRIFIVSGKLNVKLDNGKTLNTGMKLQDAVNAAGDDCTLTWTPEEGGPTIHFSAYIQTPVYDNTLTAEGNSALNEIESSFEVLGLGADAITPGTTLDNIVLNLYDMP